MKTRLLTCLFFILLPVRLALCQEVILKAGISSAPLLGYWPPAPIVGLETTWVPANILVRQEEWFDLSNKQQTGKGWSINTRTMFGLTGHRLSPVGGVHFCHMDAGLWTKDILRWFAGGRYEATNTEIILDYRGEIASTADNRQRSVDLRYRNSRDRWVIETNLSLTRYYTPDAASIGIKDWRSGVSIALTLGYRLRKQHNLSQALY